MSPLALKVLNAWRDTSDDFGYLCFEAVADRSGVQRKLIRRTVRALSRAGYLEYGKGLWSEDGPYGAGYCLTKAGKAALSAIVWPRKREREGEAT